MNRRILDIAFELEANEASTLAELAKRHGVSQRTIREDLKVLDAEVRSSGGTGVWLQRGTVNVGEGFDAALSRLAQTNFYDYRLMQGERVLVAAELLVNHIGYLTLSDIASVLCVSRATVINDLPDIKQEITRNALIISSHPSKGLRVDGLESSRRRFLLETSMRLGEHVERAVLATRFDDELGQLDFMRGIERAPVEGAATEALRVAEEVPASRRSAVENIVSEQEANHARWLTDESFATVTLYCCIAVSRCRIGQHLEAQEDTFEGSHYLMARDIVSQLSRYCGLDDTHDEALVLGGLLARMQYLRQETSRNETPLIQLVTRHFIEQVSDEIAIDLNDDFTLFECLANHLDSTMSPVPVDYPDSEVIREVIVENDKVFQAVLRHDSILRAFAGRDLTNLEVGYIVLHLCAAIERKASRGGALRIIVACNAGVGTSQLLIAKLERHFDFRLADSISLREAERLDPSEADLVISTVPLESCPIESVCVSPLLGGDDRRRIAEKVEILRNAKAYMRPGFAFDPDAKGLIQVLSSVVYDAAPDVAPALMRRIRPAVRRYFSDRSERGRSAFAPYLHQLIIPSHIVLDADCRTWEDAIATSALPLLAEGYIEQRYVDAMIESARELGPYAVLSKGFAMPHAGLDRGVNEVGMTFVRLAHPVEFGAKKFDPIEFVCCLSAIDKTTHIKALFALLSLMCDEGVKELLRQAKDADDIVAVFRQHEYGSVV